MFLALYFVWVSTAKSCVREFLRLLDHITCIYAKEYTANSIRAQTAVSRQVCCLTTYKMHAMQARSRKKIKNSSMWRMCDSMSCSITFFVYVLYKHTLPQPSEQLIASMSRVFINNNRIHGIQYQI